MAGYYRRFVRNYSLRSEPLTRLLHQNATWTWSTDQEHSFIDLKSALVSAPILATPDFNKQFIIQTDASNFGVGAVLSQRSKKRSVVIQYASRTLSAAERRYSTTERECLAVVWAVEKFRPYVEGTRFLVYTDHSSLTWLQNAKDPTGKFSRWITRLQAYDFSIQHVPGRQNQVADALSRSPLLEPPLPNPSPALCVASADNDLDLVEFNRDLVIQHQHTDPHLSQIINQLDVPATLNNTTSPDCVRELTSSCILRDGLLFKNVPRVATNGRDGYRIWLPRTLVPTVLKLNHDLPTSGHLGVFKTLKRIQNYYTWEGMTRDTSAYVRSCEVCQRHKTSQQKPQGLMKSASISEPWEVIGVDLKGPFPRSKKGTTHLLVVTDYMTKWVEIFPLKQATTRNIVLRLVDEVFTRFGLPRTIVSDNGRQFVSNIMKHVCYQLGIKQRLTSFYSPQSNQVERINRTLTAMIASYVTDNQSNFDVNIQQYAFSLRTAVHESTGFSPAFLNFGRELRTVADVSVPAAPDSSVNLNQFSEALVDRVKSALQAAKQNIQKAQTQQKMYYDQRHRDVHFAVGDRVLARAHHRSSAVNKFASKLAPRYNGPFVIAQKLSDHTYTLRPESSKKNLTGTYHVAQLKPFHQRTLQLTSDPLPPTRTLRPRNPLTGRVVPPPPSPKKAMT